MKLSKVSVFSLAFLLALGACRKKTEQLAPAAKEKPRNTAQTPLTPTPTTNTYLVKVSANDAGTAKVWSQDFDFYSSSGEKTTEELVAPYVSAYNYNTNDAQIVSLIAYYITDNGQKDTLRIDKKELENNVLDSYQAVFQVPAGKTVVVEAKAGQTGAVGPRTFYSYSTTSSYYYYGYQGNKVSNATVTLKVSILKDGKVVAQEEDKKLDKASLILTVVGK